MKVLALVFLMSYSCFYEAKAHPYSDYMDEVPLSGHLALCKAFQRANRSGISWRDAYSQSYDRINSRKPVGTAYHYAHTMSHHAATVTTFCPDVW